ncbi:DUF488 domain-containing protein [Synechocystis sp. CACIAM 05]|jgi:uncharacterized protein (DUF488 family)|uniref:DUF488 domain-containing protein n=1 Tax=Synechocystis sp. CACIAM 05 TaxID=1933929 RepID=UPI00138E9266|nr:DUF488 domain-containing protein [Synechocystis sp. CACIAM 05]QHV00775.1 hypothetical protein BWK47_12010 [Synechocystis sp. CACIAM 05]
MSKKTAIKLFTIGFTKTSAANFFGRLEKSGVRRVIDTRLNNTSQLSGFAKQPDLEYFLGKVSGISYEHQLSFAPTRDILEDYKKKRINWQDYENKYLELIRRRAVESLVNPEKIDGACLLCSEDKPHHCHRRLLAEYLKSNFGTIEVVHL